MLIDFKKVNIYQDERLILKDIDFQATEGEFIYLIGRVGSGKSSLLKTFYGELDIDQEDAEKAEVLGESVLDIKQKRIPALRRQMGIIFQDFQLLHDRSVAKNLKFVLQATGWKDKEKIKQRIREVLEQVGMIDKAAKMPSELSGGEQQRIAIARAFLNNPKIILADEPTGNLDPETASNIVSILKDTCKNGTTVIMSTHNINLLSQFPGKVYRCMEQGLVPVTNEAQTKDLEEDSTSVEPLIEPVLEEEAQAEDSKE
ncbi:cell division ATP-binding protein FtsE [Prevotella histicola]|jgi:cell division ATP-binding protein ftsE|uniref:Phosphonate ABC transporter ATP-binding protein n=1 Tax=Prevotella histicola JCM 15637 = DNF00424 TaxID=1236504 RepID=A0AAW3FB27_9BACT|nr:ATP-binding cassette domain-containing protein [Prevotella histicola]KGF24460.1 phosphonate ABC transporter ATP-binding protein [Prevotella histicola JCM 15637 = DNF00424]